MSRQIRCFLCLLLLAASLPLAHGDELAEGFLNPPRSFSMVPLWSWNGRLDPAELERQIDEMVDKGVYGAFMHARAGINLAETPYFSDGWWGAIETCVEHGREVGFDAWLYDEDKWPSGAAGGRTLARNPERNCQKALHATTRRVEGPSQERIAFPGARYVVAARLVGKDALDPESLVDISSLNSAALCRVDTTFTEGLSVLAVSDQENSHLAENLKRLGCTVNAIPPGEAESIDLETYAVIISDAGTEGAGIDASSLRAWIQAGGGYVDFSWSEPMAGLYKLNLVVEEDVPSHRWALPEHPVACLPNSDPDMLYTGRRWTDQWWRGGSDFEAFAHVLADTRHDPPGISLLAREEGKGRVVYCGATQACREPGNHVELLQNILVYVSKRDASVAAAPASQDGTPLWDCPEGEWLILAYTERAEKGINYLNRDTVRDFIDITHEEYARRAGDEFGKAIPGVFFDEIHNSTGGIVWVENFGERFRELKGYDLVPHLPALSHDVGPMTPKVRCDYYDVYTAIYEEAWFEQLADWCEEHGLELTGHTVEGLNAYKNQGNYFRTLRYLQIPMTDNEDFRYTWPRVIGAWKPKQLASIAHLYGHERAAVEAMGGAGWPFTLDSARYGFNMLAAYGINFFYPHLFHYAQDRPENVGDWPNSWFFRNPYWKYFKTFADHGSRLSYMLTGGEHVVEVAILYPEANLWAGYGGGTTADTLNALVAGHVDVDLMDPASLLRAHIADKALTIGDMAYRVLIIPGIRCLREVEADKIAEFAEAGGHVILHDRWPTDSIDAGRDDPHLAAFKKRAEAAGIEPVPLEGTVERVKTLVEPDIILRGARAGDVRYQHVRRSGRDVYWLANGRREPGKWRCSLRAQGGVSLWDPEDGAITPLPSHALGGRTECEIALDAWQGIFVVCSPEEAPTAGPAPALAAEEHAGPSMMLEGPWQFLAVGGQLDDAWRVDVESSELDLPVMRVRWKRSVGEAAGSWHLPSYDDSRWRTVKIYDSLHPADGAERYRSRWEGRFISHYDPTPFRPKMGGEGFECRTTVNVPGTDAHGWLAVQCDSPFRVFLGEEQCGRGQGGGEPEVLTFSDLKAGAVVLSIETEKATAILAEGVMEAPSGAAVAIFTDRTWEVSAGSDTWREAWEYVAPPEKPYGEPPHPEIESLPSVAWYRQALPPGTEAVLEPRIEGEWTAWANGRKLTFADGEASVRRLAEGGVLALRVDVGQGGHGLVEPVRVRCAPEAVPLGSWTEQDLAWYSGRGLYSTTFTPSNELLREDMALELNLGEVCYCAEVWLNGELVGTRVWPPYRVDVSGHVKPGENRLDIVVANLLANRMRWDIFDDAKTNPEQRKWHDGNILRDAWCLESGLLGPVELSASPGALSSAATRK